MTLPRAVIALLLATLLIPALSLAQEAAPSGNADGPALREAIRANLASDPRSSQLSEAELDAMADALTEQAIAQGVGERYLDAQNSFAPPSAPVYEGGDATLNPLGFAILALVIALAGASVVLARHRAAIRSASPPAA